LDESQRDLLLCLVFGLVGFYFFVIGILDVVERVGLPRLTGIGTGWDAAAEELDESPREIHDEEDKKKSGHEKAR